ncbi:hypothetical protein AB8Q18_14615 [Neisseriaceae bacterium CLB008]|nr:hypothetical protein [Neisseriaceae bacterium]
MISIQRSPQTFSVDEIKPGDVVWVRDDEGGSSLLVFEVVSLDQIALVGRFQGEFEWVSPHEQGAPAGVPRSKLAKNEEVGMPLYTVQSVHASAE